MGNIFWCSVSSIIADIYSCASYTFEKYSEWYAIVRNNFMPLKLYRFYFTWTMAKTLKNTPWEKPDCSMFIFSSGIR